eukprot:7943191-Heterocapsa_arctica.AAC.1
MKPTRRSSECGEAPRLAVTWRTTPAKPEAGPGAALRGGPIRPRPDRAHNQEAVRGVVHEVLAVREVHNLGEGGEQGDRNTPARAVGNPVSIPHVRLQGIPPDLHLRQHAREE